MISCSQVIVGSRKDPFGVVRTSGFVVAWTVNLTSLSPTS